MSLPQTRRMALSGYFGLMVLLTLWNTVLSPPVSVPVALALILLVVPLLFPLRGLLSGKAYTYAWCTFLALFYFIHGIGEFAAALSDQGAERYYAALEIIFSILFFTGAMFYPKALNRAVKGHQPPSSLPDESNTSQDSQGPS